MRRSDWIAVVIVGAIVTVVGALILTAPRASNPTVATVVEESATPTPHTPPTPTAGGGSATENMTVTHSSEVRVRLVESRNAAPARDIEEIRRHLMLGAPGTYIGDVLALQDSQLVRWPDGTVLRVWIAPATDATDWSAAYVDTVRSAFRAWDAANAPVRVDVVTDSASANVHVRWTDRFPEGGAIGQTVQTWDQYRWLVGGEITIATHAVSGYTLDAGWIRATALHEIGHLLGLNHSASPNDIMAAQAHAPDLSRADIATMRLLYVLPPGTTRAGR
ncbi:MAG TPA: matrixin family metalloprotease [Gemmatimonadaceae bacterium]|nr:matrixin family metalloprotease [Gemmatimonadaceae bacterium]